MLKTALRYILIISTSSAFMKIFCQPIENKFIDALINNKSSITDFVDTNELSRSERLEIKYTDVNYKWLISFDIPDEIKAGFREGKYNYTLQTMQLEDGFSVVTLAVGSINYLQKFYFLNGKFVPPSVYFTRNWEEKETKYFYFKISESKYFNDYCIKRLDDFVDSLCTLLEIEPARKKLLETEKIDYSFCKDENEVEKLTGYKSKGMSVLAFDEVITAYQTHFHEVSHILINFKMQNLGLYTLPFFMEGFAVAVGGRGGMAPRVVTDLGYYLQKTGFLTYDSILTYESFYSQDANMTYAVAGLYNRFLLDELGGKKYLELYKNNNGNLEFVKKLKTENFIMPAGNKFEQFLEKYVNEKLMYIDETDTLKPSINIQGAGGGMVWLEDYYKFFVFDNFFVGPANSIYDNISYSKLIPFIKNEPGEESTVSCKYCITADSFSISVYNLYNDELIYNYNRGLSVSSQFVPVQFIAGGYSHTFFIRKKLFANDLDNEIVVIGRGR